MMLSSSMRWKRKSKITANQLIIIISLILVSTLPIALQKEGVVAKAKSNRTLTIITPHNASIQSEFERGFTSWWSDNNGGEQIYINWLTPGGGSEVRKVIDTKFASFRKNQGEQGIENVGMDVFFGGGSYEFNRAKDNGYLAHLAVFQQLRHLFATSSNPPTTISQSINGETFYDEDRQWVGVCLSRFGICYNVDTLKRLGIEHPPETWDDLADPRYFKNIALADPTKSGSVTKAFEMILQQKMQEHIAAHPKPIPGETREQHRDRILNEGWIIGLELIQKITANARYFSDAASKIPHDVASGDAAAGMCIDYYGNTYNSKHMKEDGTSRIVFITPKGGTSVSADPVAVFKHAAEPDLAQGFVKYCLTLEGQLLWNARPDPNIRYGPHKTALRRLPIHRDLYNPAQPYLAIFTDPEAMPYESENALHYDASLTAKTFNALQVIIRVMSIDTHKELSEAWQALIENGLVEEPNDILENHFHDLNGVSYTKALNDIAPNITKMRSKITLTSRLDDLKRADFSEDRMKHYYGTAEPSEYPKLIEELKANVETLRSFDMMYLEIRQQDLAKRFRTSYGKALKNALKKTNTP